MVYEFRGRAVRSGLAAAADRHRGRRRRSDFQLALRLTFQAVFQRVVQLAIQAAACEKLGARNLFCVSLLKARKNLFVMCKAHSQKCLLHIINRFKDMLVLSGSSSMAREAR